MKLEILNSDEIALPTQIAASSLTLEEIGAIVCMMCAPAAQAEYDEAIAKRLETPEIKSALDRLKQRDVLTVEFDGKAISVKFNLDSVLPTPSQPSRPSRDTNPGA